MSNTVTGSCAQTVPHRREATPAAGLFGRRSAPSQERPAANARAMARFRELAERA
jgi:hypothetical protein